VSRGERDAPLAAIIAKNKKLHSQNNTPPFSKWHCVFVFKTLQVNYPRRGKTKRLKKSSRIHPLTPPIHPLIHHITSPLNRWEDAIHLHIPPARTVLNELCINKYGAQLTKNQKFIIHQLCHIKYEFLWVSVSIIIKIP
jgi:hypothetical protein